MKAKVKIIFLTAILLTVTASCSRTPETGGHSADDASAVSAASFWLELTDSEKYSESWDRASILFKNSISNEQWTAALKNAREHFGKLIQRKMSSADYKTSLPGAPDGEYAVIVFDSSFDKKEKAVETITLVKETEGIWKTAGYFIK